MPRLDILPFILAQTDAAGAAKDPPAKTVFDYINDAGSLGYVLVALSFVGLALIIRNLISLRITRFAPPTVAHRLDVMLRENDISGAQAFCAARENDCFLTRVFGAALARCGRSPFGFLEFRTALEEAGQTEVDRLHRFNDGIGILAAIGPMLGLLGTVFGMIGAFHAIGSLEGSTRSHQLAIFMSMALVNTAQGLIVAIPCTIAFALFKRHIDSLAGRAGKIAEELAAHLEQQSVSDKPPPPRPAQRTGPARPAEAQRGVGVPVRFGTPDRPGEATFDLTPMIDVVLLLIIFFMFTTQFARSQQAEMDLPGEKGEAKAPAPEKALFIDMQRDGTLRIGGRTVALDALPGFIPAELRSASGSVEGLDLIVRADRSAPAAHLNTLAEALARLGVRNWKLATSPDNARRGAEGAGGGSQ